VTITIAWATRTVTKSNIDGEQTGPSNPKISAARRGVTSDGTQKTSF